jgi:hypothetical protein
MRSNEIRDTSSQTGRFLTNSLPERLVPSGYIFVSNELSAFKLMNQHDFSARPMRVGPAKSTKTRVSPQPLG